MRANMQKSKTWTQDFSEVSRAINDIPALEKELRAEPKGALAEYLTQLSGAFHVFQTIPMVPEAQETLNEMAEFCGRVW